MSDVGKFENHIHSVPPILSKEAIATRKEQLAQDLARAKDAGWYA